MDSRSTTTPVDSYKQFPNGILYSLSPSSSTTLAPPLQRRFRGTGSIDNELADKSCAGLGVAGLLRNLNEVLGTTYELEGDIKALLCRYVEDPAMDFGSAYGELRRGWFSDVSTLRSRLDKGRRRDEDTRRRAIDMGRGLIVNPRITPRRVWDLYSNRVLPFWVLLSNDVPRNLWAVSHAWVELAERQHVKTRINREEWPVPIPNDVDLEQVRVELLNLGAEYVWLDVLCLRQKIRGDGDSGSPLSPQEVASEQLRAEEWKLDVPTIGHVYRCKPSQVVITYFSGLGRPFSIGHTTLKEDRAWLNRVWTMQETTPNWLLGGLTLEPFDDEGESISTVLTEFHGHMCNLLSSLSVEIPDIFALITFLLRRQGTNEIDFLGALGYLLKCPAIPIYDQKQSTEDAWDLLLQQLHPKHLTDLLIMYPDAGEGGQRRWRPSWKQLQAFCPEHTLPVTYSPRDLLQSPDPRVTSSSHGSSTITYSNSGYVIPHCRISGPSASETELRVPIGRPGTKGKSAGETFRIEPLGHGYTFSKEYCVVGVADLQYWVVGNIRKFDGSEMTFEKVGVFCISDPKERERLWHLNPGVSDVNISYV
ncbi:hypothetical protein PsYK624_046270 [Phanerochaete sordida]|uniref:Heterokaryon incompatibility domain-containing protein n=1 Tax=Phanerochaete sordida TaxID=48140 RepID=A0A9P3G631_9APHY|nr:hypothetical protein PsYK624_046270 [Phanerochaete sordida]